MAGIKDLSPRQIEQIDLLMRHGWSLDHIYSDGPISLGKVVRTLSVPGGEGAEHVMVFVDLDGKVHPPRTSGTMTAGSELHDIGVIT